MNTKILFASLLVAIVSSCTGINYYQVYKVNSENGLYSKEKIVFEDKNCVIAYNFWSEEGGDAGFNIYNKTEAELTIILDKTYFVINGVAFEYFQNRTFTKSQNSGSTYGSPYRGYNYGYVEGTGFSTSYAEKSERSIPSKTSININDYHVSEKRHIDCDLIKYPSKKSIKTVRYDRVNSPFVFYNLITYKLGIDTVKFENRFYVNQITNYPSEDMHTDLDTTVCGRKLDEPIKILKDPSSDKFYIKYTKTR